MKALDWGVSFAAPGRKRVICVKIQDGFYRVNTGDGWYNVLCSIDGADVPIQFDTPDAARHVAAAVKMLVNTPEATAS